jgi:uncharacterized protein YlxW (UPF0749 family)
MVLFSRETKLLRRWRNELQKEVRGLKTKEKQLADRLRKLEQNRSELEADKADHDGGD